MAKGRKQRARQRQRVDDCDNSDEAQVRTFDAHGVPVPDVHRTDYFVRQEDVFFSEQDDTKINFVQELRRVKDHLEERGWAAIDVRRWLAGATPTEIAEEFLQHFIAASGLATAKNGLKPRLDRPCDKLLAERLVTTTGIGHATNVVDLPLQVAAERALRPLYAALYDKENDELQMQWERFGLKVGGASEMVTHWDGSFRSPRPWPVVSSASDSPSGPRERIQSAVCLNAGPSAGWFGYEGGHRDEVYEAVGNMLSWPHSKKPCGRPFKAETECLQRMREMGCRRVAAHLRPGQAIFWYNGLCHGNVAMASGEIPRVTMYANYRMKREDEPLEAATVEGLQRVKKDMSATSIKATTFDKSDDGKSEVTSSRGVDLKLLDSLPDTDSDAESQASP